MTTLPTYYIPHGGGPWPFMPERAATLGTLTTFLRGLLADAGPTPRAIVVISGHWEEPVPTVSSTCPLTLRVRSKLASAPMAGSAARARTAANAAMTGFMVSLEVQWSVSVASGQGSMLYCCSTT